MGLIIIGMVFIGIGCCGVGLVIKGFKKLFGDDK